ncbi:MAG: 3-dehydroquinate synthase [Candidatus Acidiferrum sp.]
MKPKRIAVKSSAGTYHVLCGAGVLHNAANSISALGQFSSVHIISSPKVWRAVGEGIQRRLGRQARRHVHLFNDAESAKNMRSVELLCRSLNRAGVDRKGLLIAVGGGVVGDVAGYVAASFLRGVALVHVPTTLVAQVDSAVGGKTGVNLPEGKNLVGAFFPPRLVLADPGTLGSLPDREFRGGLAEIIKYGVIADEKLFAYLEENLENIMRRRREALDYIISRCIEIKARVVSLDERESGLRETLNFGHTFGHALESATNYRRYQHGEAVAWGMVAAALLGHHVGITRADDVSRIVALVRRLGALPPWPRLPAKRLVDAMRSDKKTQAGKLRFVLTPRIGKAKTYSDISLRAVLHALYFTPQLLGEKSDVP